MNEPDPREPTARAATDRDPRHHLQTLVLLAATASGIYLCYLMAGPFIPALAWALALAVLFAPFQRWLEAKLKRPSAAALIASLAIGVIVVVPAMFVGQQMVVQAAKGAERLESKIISGQWREALQREPRLTPLVNRIEQQIDLPGTVQRLTAWLSTTTGSIVKGSIFQVTGFFLIFYLLFFFLRDRHAALGSLRTLLPLTAAEMDRLFSRVGDTIHATVYGTLAVAGVQGLLGGLMFWWLDLPTPLLWGTVMALLAIVPVFGAFIIWIPAALFLGLDGEWSKALILTAWGVVVVGTVDNLLCPILVGKRLKQHTILAFISLVGGLIVFGPAGLILGPVVLTITMVLLEIWSPHGRSTREITGES
jgi:predicted PurR-regulated permease PerM